LLRSLASATLRLKRIAPLSVLGAPCGSTDCSVRSPVAPLCCLRIAPRGTFRAQHLKFSPARGLLRARHLASGFRLRIAPRPSTFAPCDGLGSLRSHRLELRIDPGVQVLRAQCFWLRPACRDKWGMGVRQALFPGPAFGALLGLPVSRRHSPRQAEFSAS